MLKILRDAEKSIILTCVKGEDNAEAADKPSYIPTTIMKIGKYFDHLLPSSKGKNLNLGIRLDFNVDQETMVENVEYEMSHKNIYL